MIDYALPEYDDARGWIKKAREKKLTWEEISLAKKNNEQELLRFLEFQVEVNYWPKLTVQDWKNIVDLQRAAEEKVKTLDYIQGAAQLHDEKEDNGAKIPQDEYSSWQLYKNSLLKKDLKKETVEEIERTTLKILKRLNNDTTNSSPVKGLVIGNVQSGKTANMAALMAMAADWGWNMFIVLSGTIENLRKQTQSRLFNDLNQQGTIFWHSLEHLSKSVDMSQKAKNLHFEPDSKARYFTVCLKVASRLTQLIQWAQADPNKQKQMRILVIDDEADQAGINTAKIDAAERKKINRLICALVNGKNEKNEDIKSQYKAMNYIGYTATPYANILNEAGEKSLYPKSFISTLAVSNEYFGPQQIFGYAGETEDESFDGLDIVRTISSEELDKIKDIHNGTIKEAPESLIDAICWFLCGVACMRLTGYKKPISMLVHTSQKTEHHEYLGKIINAWLNIKAPDDTIDYSKQSLILDRVKRIWDKETTRFTLENFREQYPKYGRLNTEIPSYPAFNEVEKQVKDILTGGISHIQLEDDGQLTYHNGIHLCIDNCKNNGITEEGMHVRLAYPEPGEMPTPAPAFIVIGGATLSRGLTLEGLISSFFIRSVGQADSLMQMGRWFGYRKNYELIPRIWITEKTRNQFIFLSKLDQELRDEILRMDINGISPSEYGPKVKNTPKLSFIRITSKNKMQSATESEMDFSGASNQTYLFDNNEEILRYNIELTEKFIQDIFTEKNTPKRSTITNSTYIWEGIPFNKIRPFIEAFKFNERLKVFNDIQLFLKWVSDMTELNKLGPWNILISGKKDNKNGVWEIPNIGSINKVNRSKKIPKSNVEESILNIGVLRDPRDVMADVDLDSIKDLKIREEVKNFIDSGATKQTKAYRDKAGLNTTPQLIIYRVDKDSKASMNERSTRVKLDAPCDLIGLSIYIPGGRIGVSYASAVSIVMNNDLFDDNGDVEGTDEN